MAKTQEKDVDLDKLYNTYKENYRISEASRAVGVSAGFAKKLLIKNGLYIDRVEADRLRNQKFEKKIRTFCNQKKKPSIKDVAKHLGCDKQTAYRYVNKLGLRHLIKNIKTKQQKEKERRIKLLKTMPNLTLNEMAEKTGIPKSTVSALVRENNLKCKKEMSMPEDTICWTCANYTNCSWHNNFTPVKGWKAEKTFKAGISSYCVKSCPMYEKDEQTEGRKIIKNIYKKIDDLGKYKRICGKLRINQKCLDEIAKECPLSAFKNMLNAEIEVDNSIKTFRVEGVFRK